MDFKGMFHAVTNTYLPDMLCNVFTMYKLDADF